MRILITNNALIYRSGSELYVQEVAQELKKRGHDVAVFSTDIGDLAQTMMTQGIIIVNDLTSLPWEPDVVHAQHHLETVVTLSHFSHVPAIYVCHGWKPWQEQPPYHPRILTYFAVDTKTRDHAREQSNGKIKKIDLLHNFVDLKKFHVRGLLPEKPKKALVFSNYANENNFLPYIRAACEKENISLDVVGMASGYPAEDPENIIGQYDLIFAVGRSALEALASGVPVVICGLWGVGPLVSFKDVERLRDQNFGVAAMTHELDVDIIHDQICRYDANDAMKVTRYLREKIGLDQYVDHLEKIYADTVQGYRSMYINTEDEMRAHAAYLLHIAHLLKKNINDNDYLRNIAQEKDMIIHKKEQELIKKEKKIILMKHSIFWRMRDKYLCVKKFFRM